MADVSDLRAWLAAARSRPGMFVTGLSLGQLEAQCTGWSAALAAHGIDEFGTGFNARFRDWLRTTRGWSVSRGWAEAIRAQAATDEQAWGMFFDLLDEFAAG